MNSKIFKPTCPGIYLVNGQFIELEAGEEIVVNLESEDPPESESFFVSKSSDQIE